MLDLDVLRRELNNYYAGLNNYSRILEMVGISRLSRKLLYEYKNIIIDVIDEVYLKNFKLLGKPLNNLVIVLNDSSLEESVKLNLVGEYINLMDIILRNSKRFTNYNKSI